MSQIDGKYDVTTKTPMGDQKGTLTLVTDGDSLSGSIAGEQGTIELADGAVNGDELTWSASITSPMPMKLEFTAAIDGDAISGSVKLGMFGSASFEGTRIS